jgi:hypothetical protein
VQLCDYYCRQLPPVVFFLLHFKDQFLHFYLLFAAFDIFARSLDVMMRRFACNGTYKTIAADD